MLTAGLDIDEEGKPIAIAVVKVERRANENSRKCTFRDIWFLEKLSAPSYDDAVRRVVEITEEAARRNGGRHPRLYVNVAHFGKSILSVLRGHGVPGPMVPVHLTDGDERVEENGAVKIGRGWIVSRLHELRPPRGPLAPADAARAGVEQLKEELKSFRIGDEPGPLMIALGLAVQKNWSGMLRIRTFGGPGAATERGRLGRRMMTDALDRGLPGGTPWWRGGL